MSEKLNNEGSVELCRLCLITKPHAHLISIFTNNIYSSLNDKIQDCLSIEMSENDGLPVTICNPCAFKIDEWYNFKYVAKTSEEHLRRMVQLKCESYDEPISANDDCVSLSEDDVPLIKFTSENSTINTKKRGRKPKTESRRDKTFSKVKPYCHLCDVKFVSVEELSQHQNVSHLEGEVEVEPQVVKTEQFAVYRCHVCVHEFHERKSLRKHCRDVHNTKIIQPYCCSTCPRQFPSWSSLVVHERQHTGDKPYSCDLCGKQNFISLASLKRHQMMHEKIYSCTDCGKDFNCGSALQAHIRCKHTDEKPYLCNICGRSFSLVAILNAHMTSHSTERKYKCDICGFRSKTSGNHHRHRARHNKVDVKSFNCETCSKSFETKLQLSSHSIIHRSVRPHMCKLCDKGFIYKSKLERHLQLVHAKQRPHPCPICNKKLATKFGLRIHVKTHAKTELEHVNEVRSNEQLIDISQHFISQTHENADIESIGNQVKSTVQVMDVVHPLIAVSSHGHLLMHPVTTAD